MSVESRGIGLVKKLKSTLKDEIKALTPVYISPVRRINGVKLKDRVCAMTFDDGPYNLPPSNAKEDGVCLTMELVNTLEAFGAKGTFDCIGDTSENYPDEMGAEGTPMWGGIAYDHYPDFNKDDKGGAKNCPEIIDRIISGGHEITSHTYAHRLFGPKPLVYKNRKYVGSIEGVLDDLKRFDDLLKGHGYTVALSRPPHYVDKIDNNFSAYDAYAAMNYQYLGAGPDGAGWLPLSSYEEEVAVMEKNIKAALEKDPDAFCGSIIFQKDGCNMLRRTPVADGLKLQLEALTKHGYKVVTVSELMALSQFEDLGPDDQGYEICRALLDKGMCPAFSDNCIHPEKPITREELAMVMFGWEAALQRIKDNAKGGKVYSYALRIAKEKGADLDSILDSAKDRLKTYGNILNM